jgi:hypothetical protein
MVSSQFQPSGWSTEPCRNQKWEGAKPRAQTFRAGYEEMRIRGDENKRR